MQNKKILLVDADSIAYKKAAKCIVSCGDHNGAFSNESNDFGLETSDTQFEGVTDDSIVIETHTTEDGDTYEVECSMDIAVREVQGFLDELLVMANTLDYVLLLTAGEKVKDLFAYKVGEDADKVEIHKCFRYAIAEESLAHGYKHARISKPLVGYHTIMTAMVKHFNSIMFDYLEADDAIIAMYNSNKDKYMIAAMDKDVLNQSAGVHINYHKLGTEEALFMCIDNNAIFYKYWQAIVGDPTDGYKGCPGIGKVKAGDFISPDMTEIELWDNTLRAYKSKKLGVKECLATLRLADMTQATYNDENGTFDLKLYEIPEGGKLS